MQEMGDYEEWSNRNKMKFSSTVSPMVHSKSYTKTLS